LAENFEKNRTSDDNLKVRVRLPDNTVISGFLGLYDKYIAIVTTFTIADVYPVNTEEVFQPNTDVAKLYAVGRTYGGVLMGASCSSLEFSEATVSINCAITEAGLGGPVIILGEDLKEHFAGVIVEVPVIEAPAVEVRVKYLPTKLLDESLQLFARSVTETSHFRRYSLPNKDIKSVLPAGFMLRSLMLESLGYPLPPPLVFELSGTLFGTFEEMFGELYACEGFFWDLYPYGPRKPIWERLGKDVVQNLSQSVASVSSFDAKGDTRCFACTGLLISIKNRKFVLTSASLFRTGDADCEINKDLQIEVFLSKVQSVGGQLHMYHEGYNIAIITLKDDIGAVFAHDIFKTPKSSKSKEVVAIGRPTKEHEGLLMASMGNVECGRSKGQGSKFDCKELELSTCKIKKVGIGGPLIRLEDGSFVGMNFYDESGSTPYLPRSKIIKVLKRGFSLKFKRFPLPIMLDTEKEGDAVKKNRWPVPKPYWYLGGNGYVLDQFVGKVHL
jgi:hypothetical protein